MGFQQLLKAAHLSQEMLDRRDAVKRMFGKDYSKSVRYAKGVVRGTAEREKLTFFQAAEKVCEKAFKDGKGASVGLVIAAAVELCEEEASVPQ
jgi:hypothetical protein